MAWAIAQAFSFVPLHVLPDQTFQVSIHVVQLLKVGKNVLICVVVEVECDSAPRPLDVSRLCGVLPYVLILGHHIT